MSSYSIIELGLDRQTGQHGARAIPGGDRTQTLASVPCPLGEAPEQGHNLTISVAPDPAFHVRIFQVPLAILCDPWGPLEHHMFSAKLEGCPELALPLNLGHFLLFSRTSASILHHTVAQLDRTFHQHLSLRRAMSESISWRRNKKGLFSLKWPQ